VPGPADLGGDLQRPQASGRGDVEDDLGAGRQELGGAQEGPAGTDVLDVAVVRVAITDDSPVGDERYREPAVAAGDHLHDFPLGDGDDEVTALGLGAQKLDS